MPTVVQTKSPIRYTHSTKSSKDFVAFVNTTNILNDFYKDYFQYYKQFPESLVKPLLLRDTKDKNRVVAIAWKDAITNVTHYNIRSYQDTSVIYDKLSSHYQTQFNEKLNPN